MYLTSSPWTVLQVALREDRQVRELFWQASRTVSSRVESEHLSSPRPLIKKRGYSPAIALGVEPIDARGSFWKSLHGIWLRLGEGLAPDYNFSGHPERVEKRRNKSSPLGQANRSCTPQTPILNAALTKRGLTLEGGCCIMRLSDRRSERRQAQAPSSTNNSKGFQFSISNFPFTNFCIEFCKFPLPQGNFASMANLQNAEF